MSLANPTRQALDVGLVLDANPLFPTIPPAIIVNFGAILFFGFADGLLTGVYRPRKTRHDYHPPFTDSSTDGATPYFNAKTNV